jgi:hypothetical protein
VISESSTKRTLGGAKRSLYRGERCADYSANRATIARQDPQEPVGALEAQAQRSVLLENRELVTKREDLRLQGGTGSKTGGDKSEKGDEKRAHRDRTRIS